MKLLTKTTLIYWGISLLGFLVAGYITVDLLSREMRHEVDETLEMQYELIHEHLTNSAQIDVVTFPLLHAKALPAQRVAAGNFVLLDTTFTEIDGDEIELLPLRSLRWEQSIDGQLFQLTISQGLLETEDAVEAILWAMIPAVLLLSAGMALFLALASRAMWRPFHNSLQRIAAFTPQDTKPVRFEHVQTHEFAQLNRILQDMTDRVQRDYQLQKSFAENAAHELQTPIAILQGKLETLLQSAASSAANLELLQACLDALQRMKRLNQSLLLLAKIENRQFIELSPCAIGTAVSKQVAAIQELAALKEIRVVLDLQADPTVALNATLLDLLLSNLLRNALQHNHADGIVRIHLDAACISVSNTGTAQALDASKLFQRFQKQDPHSSGSGLGLAIVHEICEAMGLRVAYAFVEKMHCFRVHFPPFKIDTELTS